MTITETYIFIFQMKEMAGNMSEWVGEEEEEEERDRAVVCLVLSEMILAFLGKEDTITLFYSVPSQASGSPSKKPNGKRQIFFICVKSWDMMIPDQPE
jgi:hypothetical protein